MRPVFMAREVSPSSFGRLSVWLGFASREGIPLRLSVQAGLGRVTKLARSFHITQAKRRAVAVRVVWVVA